MVGESIGELHGEEELETDFVKVQQWPHVNNFAVTVRAAAPSTRLTIQVHSRVHTMQDVLMIRVLEIHRTEWDSNSHPKSVPQIWTLQFPRLTNRKSLVAGVWFSKSFSYDSEIQEKNDTSSVKIDTENFLLKSLRFSLMKWRNEL